MLSAGRLPALLGLAGLLLGTILVVATWADFMRTGGDTLLTPLIGASVVLGSVSLALGGLLASWGLTSSIRTPYVAVLAALVVWAPVSVLFGFALADVAAADAPDVGGAILATVLVFFCWPTATILCVGGAALGAALARRTSGVAPVEQAHPADETRESVD